MKTQYTYLKERVAVPEKSVSKFFLWWALLFVLCIIVRLPHFLSKNFWFDGDEAIIGLMAQDLLNGSNFPVYFYGQNYGLSLVEVCSTAIFEFILGPGTWTLRLGGLLLFSLGITFVVRTVQAYQPPGWMFVALILLLVTFPTWYLWGGMVRGGYVTAFLFVCIIFYCLFRVKPSNFQLFFIGICSGVVFEAHLLILVSFSALIVWWLFQQDKMLKKSIMILAGFVFTVVLFRYFGYLEEIVWESPQPQFGWERQVGNFQMQSQGFIYGFSSFFFFSKNIPIPFWWDVLLQVFLILSGIYLIWHVFNSGSSGRISYLLILLSVLFYIFFISTMSLAAPRYWIGLFTGLLFLLVFIAVTTSSKKTSRVMTGALCLISFVGIFSGSKMKQHWYDAGVNEQKAFEGFYKVVKDGGYKAIFITDDLIQHQWNYLYGKEIPATMFRKKGERVERFCYQANETYKQNPEDVVIGGLWGIFFEMDFIPGFNDSRLQVETKYFINPDTREEFMNQGFKFIEEKER